VCYLKVENLRECRSVGKSARTLYLRLEGDCRADPLVRGRPPGRPCRDRPPVMMGSHHQPRSYRVLLDVSPDLLELPLLSSSQNARPVDANMLLARLAVMPFSDFVSLGSATAGVTSK
jgi:hypothetical protein